MDYKILVVDEEKEIVALHGGAIAAISENGSTALTVELPIDFEKQAFMP